MRRFPVLCRAMNLKNIPSERLITELKSLVSKERRIGVAILHYLQEVNVRRLYEQSTPQCRSLFEYSVKVLGYSNDAAWRRLAGMKALTEVPEIEDKIESGALSLTVVARASQFFREETAQREEAGTPLLTIAEKREVFAALEGKSTRDAEAVLNSRAAVPVETKTINIELSTEDYAKLKKLQDLLSHRKGSGSVAGVISLLLEAGLEKHDPARKSARVEARIKQSLRAPETKETQSRSRYIPLKIKRQVWLRDGGKCTFKDCNATKFLHIDHHIPHGLGGANTLENLRLLCAAHNRIEAEKVFGPWRTS